MTVINSSIDRVFKLSMLLNVCSEAFGEDTKYFKKGENVTIVT